MSEFFRLSSNCEFDEEYTDKSPRITSNEIDDQVAQFLANGGEIQVLESVDDSQNIAAAKKAMRDMSLTMGMFD